MDRKIFSVLLGARVLLFNRDWTTCSKFVNYSKLNSQHTWGFGWGVEFSKLRSHWNLCFDVEKDILMGPKNVKGKWQQP